MTSESEEVSRLRAAFAATTGTAAAGCVAPETIVNALRGTLPPGRVREVVEHTAACSACAEDWRLAVALGEMDEAKNPVRSVDRSSIGRFLRTAGLAAAAALIVAVAGITFIQQQAPPAVPVYREGEQARIQSLIAAGETLARDHCLLKWSTAGLPGTTYAVEVSAADLRPLASASGLTRPAFRVPASDLAALPSPSLLYWRVEASLPGGGHLTSPTFVTPIR